MHGRGPPHGPAGLAAPAIDVAVGCYGKSGAPLLGLKRLSARLRAPPGCSDYLLSLLAIYRTKM